MPSIVKSVNAALWIAAGVLAILIWVASDVVILFLLGFIFAYLLDPIVSVASRRKISRAWAAFMVTGGVVVLLSATVAALSPTLIEQLQGMLSVLQEIFKDLLAYIRQLLLPYEPTLNEVGLSGIVEEPQVKEAAKEVAIPLAASVLTGGMAFAKLLGFAFLLPVITFYLLKDWPRMWLWLFTIVPPRKKERLLVLGRETDQVLTAFLRGQAWVCLFMMGVYSAGLFAAGLNYALLVGIVSGALKFLPYVGTAIAVVIATGVAVGQGGDAWLYGGIFLTFAVGEVIESAILSPKIIGERVQLQPVLVILAVLVGSQVLGIIGVFLAIPAFAVGRVFIQTWLKEREELHQPRKPRPAPPTAG